MSRAGKNCFSRESITEHASQEKPSSSFSCLSPPPLSLPLFLFLFAKEPISSEIRLTERNCSIPDLSNETPRFESEKSEERNKKGTRTSGLVAKKLPLKSGNECRQRSSLNRSRASDSTFERRLTSRHRATHATQVRNARYCSTHRYSQHGES